MSFGPQNPDYKLYLSVQNPDKNRDIPYKNLIDSIFPVQNPDRTRIFELKKYKDFRTEKNTCSNAGDGI